MAHDQASRHETRFEEGKNPDQPKHRARCSSCGSLKADDFDFTYRRGAIVGEHVLPIVLGDRGIDRPGLAGNLKSAHLVELPQTATDAAPRTQTERGPARSFCRIGLDG